MAPPWVPPPTANGGEGGDSKKPPSGAKSNIRDNTFGFSFRGILYNVRGLKQNICGTVFREEFMQEHSDGYEIVGWSEPKRASDYTIEGGYKVYHCPRRLAGFSKGMGGYSILLRGRTLDYDPKRLMDDVPPETVSTLFTNGKLFDCNSEVVLVGAYVSNDPKIYGIGHPRSDTA